MTAASTNLYGDLCTELYERLHPTAPEDELAFFLSFLCPAGQSDPGATLRQQTVPAPLLAAGIFHLWCGFI